MRQKRFSATTLGALILCLSYAQSLVRAEEMVSLTQTMPEFLYAVQRYDKFYDDPRTIRGGLLDRSYVTGDWFGRRKNLADNGFYSYVGLTQINEGNIDGGTTRKFRSNGSVDLMGWFDTGKAKLWPGGLFFIHGETQFGRSMDADVGSLVPPNYDTQNPNDGLHGTALSQFHYTQALGERLTVMTGKMDLASFADCNFFANKWRSQFLNTSFVNNPQLGAVVPYTTLATWFSVAVTPTFKVVYTINTQSSEAMKDSFDKIFNGEMDHSLLFIANTNFFERPGMLHVLMGLATKDIANFAIDPAVAESELLGDIPIEKVNNNYGIFLSGCQYVQTWSNGHKDDCAAGTPYPNGWGYFYRFGATPSDRNVISRFYSLGIGGFGGPAGRIHDNWGVGWSGSYISSDVRHAVSGITNVDNWEHVVETFYNFQLMPSTRLSFHVQVNDQAVANLDTSTSFATRLQVDF